MKSYDCPITDEDNTEPTINNIYYMSLFHCEDEIPDRLTNIIGD